MARNTVLIDELLSEGASTRKLLELIADDNLAYKPHERSMDLRRLASHVAEIPAWVEFTIAMDVLDLAEGNFTPFSATNVKELLERHDANIERARKALEGADDETLMKIWKLRNGSHEIMSGPKIKIIRSMTGNHLYHHRGQLTVYLRLLEIPIPGIYGPSADDLAMMAAK